MLDANPAQVQLTDHLSPQPPSLSTRQPLNIAVSHEESENVGSDYISLFHAD